MICWIIQTRNKNVQSISRFLYSCRSDFKNRFITALLFVQIIEWKYYIGRSLAVWIIGTIFKIMNFWFWIFIEKDVLMRGEKKTRIGAEIEENTKLCSIYNEKVLFWWNLFRTFVLLFCHFLYQHTNWISTVEWNW